jgi:hypothetical protein
MTTQILKAVLLGVLGGALIFFMPFFLFNVLFIVLIIGFIFRFFGFKRRGFGPNDRYNFWNPSYTQRWQNMSEDERRAFTQKMEKELFAGSQVTNI